IIKKNVTAVPVGTRFFACRIREAIAASIKIASNHKGGRQKWRPDIAKNKAPWMGAKIFALRMSNSQNGVRTDLLSSGQFALKKNIIKKQRVLFFSKENFKHVARRHSILYVPTQGGSTHPE
ncbi:MAG: hypothetical protein KDK41_18245, partial [Leptospiraceae bacterium]|nr:hypothetical protein [Leptospiraceae bacterium]